nr:GFA family protein [Xanthomonas campestris pv. campestris]
MCAACWTTHPSVTAACVRKAFGAYYAPLVSVRGAAFRWTRGEPKRFASSTLVQRGFCAECGTPLTYEAPDGVAIAAGAFDTPGRLPPHIQYGLERKVPFVDTLTQLPTRPSEDDAAALAFQAALVSHQHPDHDTERWPV